MMSDQPTTTVEAAAPPAAGEGAAPAVPVQPAAGAGATAPASAVVASTPATQAPPAVAAPAVVSPAVQSTVTPATPEPNPLEARVAELEGRLRIKSVEALCVEFGAVDPRWLAHGLLSDPVHKDVDWSDHDKAAAALQRFKQGHAHEFQDHQAQSPPLVQGARAIAGPEPTADDRRVLEEFRRWEPGLKGERGERALRKVIAESERSKAGGAR